MWDDCCGFRHGSQAFKLHQQVPISAKASIVCLAHNKDLEFFCEDCAKPQCYECQFRDCKGHRVEELGSVAMRQRASLSLMADELCALEIIAADAVNHISELVKGTWHYLQSCYNKSSYLELTSSYHITQANLMII